MPDRRILKAILPACLLFGTAVSAAAALPARGAIVAYLSHETDLKHNPALVGQTFRISASFGYENVPADRILLVRISSTSEPGNASRKGLPSQDPRESTCDGVFRCHFDAHFNKQDFTDRIIMIDAYIQSKDGRTLDKHLSEHIRIHVVPKPSLAIEKVHAPRPPDTVLVGEAFDIRLDFSASGLVQGSKIKAVVEAVSGGSGRWIWESRPLEGDAALSSDPIKVKLNKAGSWKFRVTADTTYAEASAVTFQMQAVEELPREVDGIRLSYPALPETVQVWESVGFELAFSYRNFPPGTQVWAVFADPETGQDITHGWALSPVLQGDGTCTIRDLRLAPTRIGAWKVDVMLRLPRLNAGMNDFDTVWKETALLRVLEKIPGHPGNPEARPAQITRIKKPSGTLLFEEPFPVTVLINYDKLGDAGVVLEAQIIYKGTGSVRGSRKSIVLKKSGSYAFPDFSITANPVGPITFEVRILAPDGRLLHSRTFTVTAVEAPGT
jgi:hypothetical protein